MRYAKLGSVGKVEYTNPVETFELLMEELEYQLAQQDRPEDKTCQVVKEARNVHNNLLDTAYADDGGVVLTGDVLTNANAQLQEMLGQFAAPYTFFGFLFAGDYNEYGYLPDMGQIVELQKFDEEPDEPQPDDYAVVNDHGNVTVYGADGSVLLEIV